MYIFLDDRMYILYDFYYCTIWDMHSTPAILKLKVDLTLLGDVNNLFTISNFWNN